jgi:hypothetical protein
VARKSTCSQGNIKTRSMIDLLCRAMVRFEEPTSGEPQCLVRAKFHLAQPARALARGTPAQRSAFCKIPTFGLLVTAILIRATEGTDLAVAFLAPLN